MKKNAYAIAIAIALTSFACSSARQPQHADIDPTKDPTAIGAIAAAADATNDALPAAMNSDAAKTGRHIGMAVGVMSAIFGGSDYEPIQASIARYRAARDLGQALGVSHELRNAAEAGAKRGFAFDQQMVQLKQIEGIDVTRSAAYQLDVRFTGDAQPLDKIAGVITSGDERFVIVDGRGAEAAREALMGYGISKRSIEVHDNNEPLLLHILFE